MTEEGGEPRRVATSTRGMVATAHHEATVAGASVLAAGGNAVDAAVAAALALGVCEPAASGLGGQTMMTLHLAGDGDGEGRTFALDGSSRAPNLATVDAFDNLRRERRRGHRATTVPSSPAVYQYALERYGRLSAADVLAPAIGLAEAGYAVSRLQERLTRRELRHLRASPGAAALFLRSGRKPYRAGAVFRQPVLARTLRRLADASFEDFYLGETAERIVSDMAANGGFIRDDDLAQVPQPVERDTLVGCFAGDVVHTMPLPGAGRTLIEMLNIHRALPAGLRDIDTPEGAVLLAKTIRQAFQDRHDRPFDPDLYPQVDDKEMLSTQHARRLAAELRRDTAGSADGPEGAGRSRSSDGPSRTAGSSDGSGSRNAGNSDGSLTSGGSRGCGGHGQLGSSDGSGGRNAGNSDGSLTSGGSRGCGSGSDGAGHSGSSAASRSAGSGETTHLSVMDAEGNAVALTQSIENVYGACAAGAELGFLYNNYLAAFEHSDMTHPYYLRPNAVPWASVAPTLVLRDGQCRLAIGSPGSERITPAILQVLLRMSEGGLSPLEAVAAPRLHCSLDGVVSLESARISSDIAAALAAEGFELDRREAFSFYLGCVQLVLRRGTEFCGVADPRRDGAAAGAP